MPPRARLPFRSRVAAAQSRQFLPRFAAVCRFEHRGVFDAGVNVSGSVSDGSRCQTRLNSQGCCVPSYHWWVVSGLPVSGELVNELVALALRHSFGSRHQVLRLRAGRIPGFAAVVGALDDLSKPATRLRRVNPVRINRRPFHVINFPARKMRAADLPSSARAIRRKDERALSCSD